VLSDGTILAVEAIPAIIVRRTNRGSGKNGLDRVKFSHGLGVRCRGDPKGWRVRSSGPRDRFDVIICSELLEHLQEPETYLEGFNKLLDTPGILIVSVPNGYGPFELLKRLERWLARFRISPILLRLAKSARSRIGRLWRRLGGAYPDPIIGSLNDDSPHVNFFRLPELHSMFRRTGFTVLEVRGRTFLCGRFVDIWLNRWPFKYLLPLNNALGDWLPLRFCSDWMLLLSR